MGTYSELANKELAHLHQDTAVEEEKLADNKPRSRLMSLTSCTVSIALYICTFFNKQLKNHLF